MSKSRVTLQLILNEVKATNQRIDRLDAKTDRLGAKIDEVDAKVNRVDAKVDDRFQFMKEQFYDLRNEMNSRFDKLTGEMNSRFDKVDGSLNVIAIEVAKHSDQIKSLDKRVSKLENAG